MGRCPATLPRILLLAFVLVACSAKTGSGGEGVLDAAWKASTTKTDGSPMDRVSYRVYYGTTPRPCPDGPYLAVSPATPSPGQTVTARVTGLTVGQLYYVSVTAVDSRGVASGCSQASSATARHP